MKQEDITPDEQKKAELESTDVQNESYKYVFYITTALVAVAALYVAWLYISSEKDWGFDIEWAFWKSTVLWPILSVIGFFLQFIDWQHFSFDEGILVKKPSGEKEFYKNNDILSFLWGHVLWPLVAHLFLIPCAYGAVLYYIVMAPIALLNAILPYLAAALCILIIVYFFVIAKKYETKTPVKAYVFLIITTLLSLTLVWLLSLPTSEDFDFAEKKTFQTSPTSSAYYSNSSEYNDEEPDCDTYDEDCSEESYEVSQDSIIVSDNQDEVETETDEQTEGTDQYLSEEQLAVLAEQDTDTQQAAPQRPSRETQQSSLIRANVSSVSYENGNVEIHIVLRTPMVRRQFTITGTAARDENNQWVSVSKVDIVGIQKERGHDYYIITDKDTVYLTVVIPRMPSTGGLKFVRVNMSLSGSSEWVTVKNIYW
ncbi:hypothetical protein SAMN04487901_10173 [Prevotella communis]|uniref:Uncharacterized protein n=1 Tax=Prevotella communis TaxID=2913614 RepID=A0A1G7RS74_9BACT|nr:hypothetical protein [Prevotella communis]SDG13474.1 hypothetical protein SAMN04487901_10173 [Prevotella communis]